jgi:hypothetical protein
MTGPTYDGDGYEVYSRPRRATYLDGPMQTGVLYPGGAHRTWGRVKDRRPSFLVVHYGPEPEGAAGERRKHKAEDKRREKDGERLHPIDPTDPYSPAAWSTCEANCPIHNT